MGAWMQWKYFFTLHFPPPLKSNVSFTYFKFVTLCRTAFAYNRHLAKFIQHNMYWISLLHYQKKTFCFNWILFGILVKESCSTSSWGNAFFLLPSLQISMRMLDIYGLENTIILERFSFRKYFYFMFRLKKNYAKDHNTLKNFQLYCTMKKQKQQKLELVTLL